MGAGSSRGPTAASSAAAASVGEGSQHSRGSASGKGLLSGLIERLPERLVLGSARLACWETDRTSPQLAIGRRVTSSKPRARDEVASVNGDSPSMLCGSNDETHSAEMSLSGGLGSRRGTCGKQDTAQLIIDLAVLSHHAQAERGTSTSFVSGFNRGLRSELKKARKSVDSAVAKLKQGKLDAANLEGMVEACGARLLELRAQVDAKGLDRTQCLERYSQMIRTVLDASVWMAEGYSGTSMAASAVTITVYLETKEHYARLRGLFIGVVTQGCHKLTAKEYATAVKSLGSYESLMAVLERSMKVDKQQIAMMHAHDAAMQELEAKISSSKAELEIYLSMQTPSKLWDAFTARMAAMEKFRRQIMAAFKAEAKRCSDEAAEGSSTGGNWSQASSGSGLDNIMSAMLRNRGYGQASSSSFTSSQAPMAARAWYVNLDEVHIREELGTGVLGTTFAGEWEAVQVAIKMIPQANLPLDFTPDMFDDLLEVLHNARHPMLCQLLGASYVSNTKGALIYELHDAARSVTNILETQPDQFNFFSVAVQIAEGLRYLHSSNLKLHGRLKGSNVLITDTGLVKMVDYGLTELTQGRATSGQGNGQPTAGMRWMAPEAATTGKQSQKSDIYSLGILLWELLTKETAYASLERHGVLFTDAGSYVAKSSVVPKLPVGTPPGVASLIESCWNLVEDDRPTVDAVLSQLRHLSDTLGEPELQFVNSGHWGCGTQDRMITVDRALFR